MIELVFIARPSDSRSPHKAKDSYTWARSIIIYYIRKITKERAQKSAYECGDDCFQVSTFRIADHLSNRTDFVLY